MIVVKDKQAYIFKTDKPQQFTTIIPTAKHFLMKGVDLIAVPHRLDETKVLKNMGVQIPSPINYYYDFPGMKPFQAQIETSSFLTMYPRAFVLNSLGTGKTISTLWAYDYLRSQGKVNKMLVVAPLSTLERTWADEIFKNFPHLSCAVLHGDRKKRKRLLDNTDFDVYVINHDGLGIIKDDLAKRTDIDIIVVDEIAQCARTAGTVRWKNLDKIINKQCSRYAWGITATPTPNSPTDAWAQCVLIHGINDKIPAYFKRFRDLTMRQKDQYTWIPKDNANDVVFDVLQPAIRFTREDCTDLPECTYSTRTVELTPEQDKAYKDMMRVLKTEYEGGEILAMNQAVKLGKLIQIASGVAYGNAGEEICLGAEPRLNVVTEIIEGSDGKVIVFVPFRSAIDLVVNHITGMGIEVGVIHGGIAKHERDTIFHGFQRGSVPRVLVAQPAAMSHGLTLTAANTIVWYAPITSNETYMQANGRINRISQKLNTHIIHIEGTPVERKIYGKLKDKGEMQEVLLEMIKENDDI